LRRLPGLAGWVALLLPPLHVIALPVRVTGPRGVASQVQASARMANCASHRELEQSERARPGARAGIESATADRDPQVKLTCAEAWSDISLCVAVEMADSGDMAYRLAAADVKPESKYALSFYYKCRPPPARAANGPRACALTIGRNLEGGGAGMDFAAGPRKALERGDVLAPAGPDGLTHLIHLTFQACHTQSVICMGRRHAGTIPFPPVFEARGRGSPQT